MNSEVSFNENFCENIEKEEYNNAFINGINFSWVRVVICSLMFIGLLFCKHFYMPFYTEIGAFYSASFKNDDNKIYEIKNSILGKLENIRLEIKSKINAL